LQLSTLAVIDAPVKNQEMAKTLITQQRMDARRANGNRKVHGVAVQPTHRGADYLIAHACFDCRKSWKMSGDHDHQCPECQKPLSMMGRSFRTPSRLKRDQWEKVQRLWEAGFRFWSYRSYPDAEPFPDDLRDVDAFIRRNPDHPMKVKI
jgi:hypothetical protein